MNQTTISLAKEKVKREWVLLNAEGVVLGRLATTVVNLLRGKGKVDYTPHVDCGDYVVVIHADKVKLTGKKEEQKLYYRHSFYPGHLRTTPVSKVRMLHPERILYTAVRKMLRNNRLNRQILRKLKIYAGADFKEKAQNPKLLALKKYEE